MDFPDLSNEDGIAEHVAKVQAMYPGFPFIQYELVRGVTTNWPKGTIGYDLELELCEVLITRKELGYGRIAQIAQLLQGQAERDYVESVRLISYSSRPDSKVVIERSIPTNEVYVQTGDKQVRITNVGPSEDAPIASFREDAPGGDGHNG